MTVNDDFLFLDCGHAFGRLSELERRHLRLFEAKLNRHFRLLVCGLENHLGASFYQPSKNYASCKGNYHEEEKVDRIEEGGNFRESHEDRRNEAHQPDPKGQVAVKP